MFIYIDDGYIVNTYRSDVELHSTKISVVPGPMSSSDRHVILQCFVLVFPKLALFSSCFWNLNVTEFLENEVEPVCWDSQ
jgi:hypothetical protein